MGSAHTTSPSLAMVSLLWREGMLDSEKRGCGMVPFVHHPYPKLPIPQRRTPPGFPSMVACVAAWWLSLSA